MTVGYALSIHQRNKSANKKSVGVRLGAYCIRHGISVAVVAKQLGVTRQAVYNWFVGTSVPHKDMTNKILELYKV